MKYFLTTIVVFLFLNNFAQIIPPGEKLGNIISKNERSIYWKEINNSYLNEPFYNPVTFSDITKVFSKPDSNSSILIKMNFNTSIKPIKIGEIEIDIKYEILRNDSSKYLTTLNTIFNWISVLVEDENKNLDTGYIMETDIANRTLVDYENINKYFIKDYSTDRNTYIYKYDLKRKVFKDTLIIESDNIHIVRKINRLKWSNINILFRLTSIEASCGGGAIDLFIADTKDSLFVLKSSGYSNIEDISQEDAFRSRIFFPLLMKNNTIQLIESGDLDKNRNFGDGIKIFYLPKDFKFPIKNILVEKIYDEKAIKDKKGNLIMLKNKRCKTKVTNTINYYQWNGNRLILIKKNVTSYFSSSNVLLDE